MTRSGRWLVAAGLVATWAGTSRSAARAAVDASGEWVVQGGIVSPVVEHWIQVGSTLTTDTGFAGTIDANTGSFAMTRPSDPLCEQDTRSGTVSADSGRFTALDTLHFAFDPTLCRFGDPLSLSGQRTGCGDCDDGQPCTADYCGLLGCVNVPDVRPCRSAHKSSLLVRTGDPDTHDKLVWKWLKGMSTEQRDFADPRSSSTYTFCLFAGTSAAVVGQAEIPPDGLKWATLDNAGFTYADASGAADGIRSIILQTSLSDQAKIVLKGKGAALVVTQPPLGAPVTAQLSKADATNYPDLCWSATYDAADVIRSQVGLFKAKSVSP